MTPRKLILTLAIPLVLLASSNSLVAEPSKDAALDQEIYALLEAMGSAKIAEQVFDTLAQSFSQMNPNIPKTFWAEMKKAIKAERVPLALAFDGPTNGVDDGVVPSGAQHRAQIGRVVVAEAGVQGAVRGETNAVARITEVLGDRRDDPEAAVAAVGHSAGPGS